MLALAGAAIWLAHSGFLTRQRTPRPCAASFKRGLGAQDTHNQPLGPKVRREMKSSISLIRRAVLCPNWPRGPIQHRPHLISPTRFSAIQIKQRCRHSASSPANCFSHGPRPSSARPTLTSAMPKKVWFRHNQLTAKTWRVVEVSVLGFALSPSIGPKWKRAGAPSSQLWTPCSFPRAGVAFHQLLVCT